MGDYISVTDTAKLVREDLKKHFPTVKFVVHSKKYAGGSSIDVAWADGPTTRQVESVVGKYHGADFDGMQDLKTYTGAPYANDFIFSNRHLSSDTERREMEGLVKEYGLPERLLESPDSWDESLKKAGDPISLRNLAYRSLSQKDLRSGFPTIPPKEPEMVRHDSIDTLRERHVALMHEKDEGEIVQENKWARIRSLGKGKFIVDGSGPRGWIPQSDYVDKIKAEDIYMGLQPASEAKHTVVKDWQRLRDWELMELMKKGYPEAVAEYKRRKSTIVAQAEEVMSKRQSELSSPSRHQQLRASHKAARKQRSRNRPFDPSVSRMRR